MIYKDILSQSNEEFQENKKLIQKFKKSNHRELDQSFHKEHEKVFKSIDCLACANCCKTTSPIFRDIDIKRIANKLRIPIGKFIDLYLKIDEDNDYVLKQSPCTFLSADNTCDIYEDRPLACREYPHTNRKNMYQILDLTLKNSHICPAVSKIFTNLKPKK
jgi:Fe-S-cluster containining protein